MDTSEYLYNWWLWLVGAALLILFIIGIFHVILRFPGILDWKFIMQNFEERVQEPVKKFSSSLYGHLVVAGGEVVRKISTRRTYSYGAEDGRTRKNGVCEVNFDPHVIEIEDQERDENVSNL